MEDFEIEFKQNTLHELDDLFGELSDVVGKQSDDINSSDIDNIFRIVHSVKGNSKVCEFVDISNVSHEFENLLIKVRDGNESYSQKMHNITLEYCDRVQEAIETTKSNLEFIPDFDTLFSLIRHYEDQNEEIAEVTSLEVQANEDPSLAIETPNLEAHDALESFNPNGHNLSQGNVELKVLIVDDDPNVSEIVQIYLENHFKIEQINAENGSEALDICGKNEFHFIICDFKMPIMNGGEFIKTLRSGSSSNKNTPILFISGFNPKITAEQSMWENVFFMEKPFSESKMLYYARCALELKEAGLYSMAL